MTSFVINVSETISISHISSPDISFLRGLKRAFSSTKTKLVFCFGDQDATEPSTNQTYGFLLRNLTSIKSFASGILVPKVYIWPVDETSYLLPHTSLVADAHKTGLQVFAEDFANDNVIAHNYSYNPVTEYLSFIDNGDFSVDGVLSDFPLTSSAARECFAHLDSNASAQAKPLVISECGASGDYPGCTDLSYTKAILDGADVIDCPVQMSKDGVPFCLSSGNLIPSTQVALTQRDLLSNVYEIQSNPGIFSFSLNWSDIQALTPVMPNPYPYQPYELFGNPKFRNAGKIISLSEFLDLATYASSLSGVLIKIQNAKYLAENQGMNITNAVLSALKKADSTYLEAKRIMIQSTESAVLKELQAMQGGKYELVFEIEEPISDVSIAAITYIATFANSVVINKESVFPENQGLIINFTDIVSQFRRSLLPVYVGGFRNEHVNIPYDCILDPVVEINLYAIIPVAADGIITAFPQTAVAYKKNRCLTMKTTPVYMDPLMPTDLIHIVPRQSMPMAKGPYPVLTDTDVWEAPLPPATPNTSSVPTSSTNGKPKPQSKWFSLLSFLYVIVAVSL